MCQDLYKSSELVRLFCRHLKEEKEELVLFKLSLKMVNFRSQSSRIIIVT